MKYPEYPASLVNENHGRYEPNHARCYCVATAAGVATVVGGVATAASAGYSAYESSQQGKAGGGGSASDLYGTKTQPAEYKNHVTVPSYDPVTGASDYLTMLPTLRQMANSETNAGRKKREKIMPGSNDMMKEAGANLLAMSRGQVSQDTVDRTNRIIAERNGGAIDPSAPDSYAGGVSQDAADFSRAIGRTSDQNVNNFLSAAPQWEALADQFAYTPGEMLGSAMDMLKTRFDASMNAAQLQLHIDENMYGVGLNTNKALAAPDPRAVGARNDALLMEAMKGISGGSGNYLTAINGVIGGLSGMSSGVGQVKSANGGAYKGAIAKPAPVAV